MTTSIRSGATDTGILLNGVEKVTIDSTGIISDVPTRAVGNNSTKIASTAYVDAPKLGTRSVGLTSGVNYLAPTDGFIYGSSVSSATSTIAIAYSDATTTPSTLLGNIGSNTTTNNYYFPFCFPVKKGEYFRIDVTGTALSTYKLMSLGV